MIVDAHHHVWDPAAREHAWLGPFPELRRQFSLADYTAACAPAGITASVLVQVLASTAETEEFLALAADHAHHPSPSPATTPGAPDTLTIPVAGVVGWADLTRPGIADEIARLRARPGGDRLVGIRHLVQGEPDPAWLDRPEVRHGLAALGRAGLAYDLLVRPAQLAAAVRVTGELDEVRFVLDHGGKPDIAAGRLAAWAEPISELAARPNVSCKLSGLVTEAGPGWTAERITPFTDRLLDTFGPGRLMFGSDWPVCTLAADYHEVMELARTVLSGRLSSAEQAAVFGRNAVAAYRLPI
jgi:L-fuconolactonase